MKRWLVIGNSQYYPSAGTGDWLDVFVDEEKAHKRAKAWIAQEKGNSAYVVDLFRWMGISDDAS